MSEPRWLSRARGYIGTREFPGKQHNPVIVRWWRAIKSAITDDESPWCAGFVGGVLEESGVTSSRKANARSYTNWGTKLSVPSQGCIVVFWRGSPSGWQGHVGFVVGQDRAGNLMVLGGNQGDAVNIKPFSRGRVIGYYWPKDDREKPDFKMPLLNSDGRVSTNEA